jgi:guanylate kinase
VRELRAKAAGTPEPRVFVLSSPSGIGKDAVIEGLRRRVAITAAVTCTTRPRRGDEVDGEAYRFLSREAFEEMRARGDLLESAEYAGHCYGVPRRPVQEALARGEDVLLKIEVQGAAIVKLKIPSTVLIFVAPPDVKELEARLRTAMRARGAEDEADIARRLAAASRELACIPGYDYLVINHLGRLDEAVAQIETIVLAERARVGVPPAVV